MSTITISFDELLELFRQGAALELEKVRDMLTHIQSQSHTVDIDTVNFVELLQPYYDREQQCWVILDPDGNEKKVVTQVETLSMLALMAILIIGVQDGFSEV